MAEAQVGPYRIRERLGGGGNGVVFLAEDTRLRREVALKTLSGTGDDEAPEMRRKTLREARAAARLNHPNIAAVYDVLESDEAVHIVMEYVPGQTLASRLRQGPLPHMEVLDIAVQLSGALTHAHALGVIHRDLKPGNIVVSPSGQAKILDFGLARHVDPVFGARSSSDVSDPHQIVGTPPYMPPELLRGEGYGARGDIYSLGVTLFELLTGRRPFEASNGIALSAAILGAPTPRVRSVAPDVPAELDGLIYRAMARDPQERWAGAGALESALRGILDRIENLETRPAPWPIVRRVRQSRLAAPLAALAAAAAVGVITAIAMRPPRPPPLAPSRQVVAVLPLLTSKDDRVEQSMAGGLADAIVSALSKMPSVTVVSRAATVDAVGREKSTASIIDKLGATLAFTGQVDRAGDAVRVMLSLTGPQLRDGTWREAYTGRATDLLPLQARAVAGAMGALQRLTNAATATDTPVPPTADVDALADFGQARAFLARPDLPGSVDRSVALFQAAIARDPRFARAHAGLGEAYFSKYQSTGEKAWGGKAREATLEALRLDPADGWVRFTLAKIYRESGRTDDAIEELRRAIAVQPANDEAHSLLGQTIAQRGDVDGGLAHIRDAIALRPAFWANHQALGVVLYSAGRYEEAIPVFKRVTELQPDTAWGFQMLGTAYHALGQRELARANYEKAVALGHARAHSNLGVLDYEEGRYPDAARHFEEAVRLEPNVPSKHRNLGDAYRHLGRQREARASYRRAVEISREHLEANPGDPLIRARLAVYEAKLGEQAEALRLADEASASAPGSAEVVYRAAVTYVLAGRPEQGMRTLERALELGYSAAFARQDEDLQTLRTREDYRRIIEAKAPHTEAR